MNAKYHSQPLPIYYGYYMFNNWSTHLVFIRVLFVTMRSRKINVSGQVVSHEIHPNISNQFLSKLLHTRELYKLGPFNC